MQKVKTVAEAVAFIHSRQRFKKTPSFKRLTALLAALGHPEKASRFIHVTGTNGKGSTSKMIAQLLRQAGLAVGLFSSPYIMRFNERIQDNAGPISDDDLLAVMQTIEPIVADLDQSEELGPTEFEIVTAAMFLYFKWRPVDVVVLEVGIGGTWDSTEIIPDKLISVITTVSLDHMRILGSTIAAIASQKAGIIQSQRPVVVGALPKEALAVVESKAHALQAPLYVLGTDFQASQPHQVDLVNQYFDFQNSGLKLTDIRLALQGNYQVENAAIAIQTVLLVAKPLGIDITATMIRQALGQVTWPGRFETVLDSPKQTIIDGAHNQAGIAALAKTLAGPYANQKVGIIFAALEDKNVHAMLSTLMTALPNIKLYVVPFQAPSKRQAVQLVDVQTWFKETTGIHFAKSWQSAYQALLADPSISTIVLTGSLYFISAVRQSLLEHQEKK